MFEVKPKNCWPERKEMNNNQEKSVSMSSRKNATDSTPVRVVAICGGKGGVGKTNVAINLSLALSSLGQKSLLLDGDLGLANIDTLLGIQPKFNLSHLLDGICSINQLLTPIARNVDLVPAASGVCRMSDLSSAEQMGLISSFSGLKQPYDNLIIDCAPGIDPTTLQLMSTAQEVLLVVVDEPASMTDAYATIKVLRNTHGISRFRVLVNMTRRPDQAAEVFQKIARVADRFLDVSLHFEGGIPFDKRLGQAIQSQEAVIHRFPSTPASMAFIRLARSALGWPQPARPSGKTEFFVERLLPSAANLELT